MSIEARQIQETLYSYAAILNFTPSPQGLHAKFGSCSVQNAQLFLMCAPEGNSKFCFPENLNVSQDKVEGNIEALGKTKLTIS